jgi:hypothetical protein
LPPPQAADSVDVVVAHANVTRYFVLKALQVRRVLGCCLAGELYFAVHLSFGCGLF